MIRVGLIGCGYIAEKHLKSLASIKELQLRAISDVKREKMEKGIHRYQALNGSTKTIAQYTNYEDMLVDDSIDVVIICVISSMHATIAKQALKYNKHVIIEKPLALSIKEAEVIIELAKEKKKQVLVCHQLRYLPLIEKLKQVIEKGYLGELYLGVASLRLNRSTDYYSSSTWKGTWAKDGGMLVNQGIHLVDLLVWLMGDIKSVYGELGSTIKEKETEDIATGIISFKDDAKGLIEANTITKPANIGYSLSIFGKRGTICIGGEKFNQVHYCYFDHCSDEERNLTQISSDL